MILFIVVLFALSLLPFLATFAHHKRDAEPVQEMRVLAAFPAAWQGRAVDVDKNYAAFEKWFADNLGFRNWMIRAKNELDYRLFRSSSRVYYGRQDMLFGRRLTDVELPDTERLLATPADVEAAYQGVVRYAAALRAAGATPVFVVPVQKQYFVRDRLPFFAPRLPAQSNFMRLYARMRATRQFSFIDVYGVLLENEGNFPLYYRQDFHWTDLAAREVMMGAVNRIAAMEGRARLAGYPRAIAYQPFEGSEARFASRLAMRPVREPMLKQTWTDRHTLTRHDAKATGLEFETGALADADLLPATCLYGNSFSDGMLRAGMPNFFARFTKFDRDMPLARMPELVRGRCKYVVVQILDIQTWHWAALKG